ncbi:MAG TPA: hypothetical protein VEK08_02380 [Planctomycetota bacterium]|nr:hypothetical protein [Planctomycetota bacterium]
MTPILAISYDAPPRLTGHSISTTKALAALQAFAPEIVLDVLCASAGEDVSSDEKLEDLLPETLRIHRIDPFPRGRQTILQRIIGGQGGWQNAAVQKAAALFPAEHKKPALIYSRSHPPASNLVALDLVNGPFRGVPWVAYFNEPWSGNTFYKSPVTRAALGRYERQIFETATELIFATDALRDAMLAGAEPEILAKAHVIPPAFHPDWYGKAELPVLFRQIRPAGKVIAHVGDLHPYRSPAKLYEAIAALSKQHADLAAKLHFWQIGEMDESFVNLEREHGVAGNVQLFSPVSYLESLAVMKAADVLLLIDSPVRRSVFLPSKLVDYLGARKPILGLTPKGSYCARLLESWGQPWCDITQNDALTALLKRIAAGEIWAPPPESVLADYTFEATGKKRAGILTRCLANTHVADVRGSDEDTQP